MVELRGIHDRRGSCIWKNEEPGRQGRVIAILDIQLLEEVVGGRGILDIAGVV